MKYHRSNFKSIAKLIEPLVKRHGHVNIISYSKLLNIWETVVGEDISKKAHPIGIKTIKGGEKNILHLGMTGPYMAELSLQTRDIIEKITLIIQRGNSSDKIATIYIILMIKMLLN